MPWNVKKPDSIRFRYGRTLPSALATCSWQSTVPPTSSFTVSSAPNFEKSAENCTNPYAGSYARRSCNTIPSMERHTYNTSNTIDYIVVFYFSVIIDLGERLRWSNKWWQNFFAKIGKVLLTGHMSCRPRPLRALRVSSSTVRIMYPWGTNFKKACRWYTAPACRQLLYVIVHLS